MPRTPLDPHPGVTQPGAGHVEGWCHVDEAAFLSRANCDDAVRAYHAYHEAEQDTAVVQKIGRGQNRTAYLVGGIVYKMDGWPPENVHDHQILQRARRAGMPWAPPSALFELQDSNGRKEYVMAMPYFVNDGSAPDPEAMALMRAQTNNRDPDQPASPGAWRAGLGHRHRLPALTSAAPVQARALNTPQSPSRPDQAQSAGKPRGRVHQQAGAGNRGPLGDHGLAVNGGVPAGNQSDLPCKETYFRQGQRATISFPSSFDQHPPRYAATSTARRER